MKNIAVSIDTLGGAADAAIVAISALSFDPHGTAVSEVFHRSVDIDSCLLIGMSVDGKGIRHWAEIMDLNDPRIPLPIQVALLELQLSFDWQNATVWMDLGGNHAAVLDTAHRKNHSRTPWAFYNLRDVTTYLNGTQTNVGDSRSTALNIATNIQAANREYHVKQA